MKSAFSLVSAGLVFAVLLPGQAVDVGSGNVSETVRRDFIRAYFRNLFHTLTALPPNGEVRRFGTGGYVQEFPDAAKTQNVRYALVRNTLADTSAEGAENTFQMYPGLYSYYSQVGANTAGYPTSDTITCPSAGTSACTFALFDKNYALFVYSPGIPAGANFAVKDPFFTRWRQFGVGGLGPPVNAEETINSTQTSGNTAVVQRFTGGAIYNYTAGSQQGRVLLVREPIYSFYQSNGAESAFLGLPLSEETIISPTRKRQTFEGGSIDVEQGQTPVLRLPVSAVSISGNSTTDRLNLGDTVTLTAAAFAANGASLTDRSFSWLSSNTRVLAVEPSGATARVRAVGGGAANITVVSEGKTSRAITFFVTAPCCQIGEGAPTAVIAQTFQDAVTRNRLAVKLPSPSPVRRLGNGFVQELLPADANSTARYLLAKADTQLNAFVVTGPILARFLTSGGASGALGFPLGDPTAGGRQLFEGGALAGNPVQLVAAPVLARWAAQSYEAGPAGLPAAPVESVLSFSATVGLVQAFRNGAYVAHTSGPLNGRVFFVTGLILAKYGSLGGATGSLGLPIGEDAVIADRHRQDFEGGFVEYRTGDAEARAEERERRPVISATPSTVSAGNRLRIAAGGFPAGATLRITVGNQPDFIVPTKTGAYSWDVFIPASQPSGLVNLRAADVNSRALAVGSFVVQSGSEILAKVTKVRGDLQTGVPGARLPQPVVISVADDNGNALVGVAVRFNASPGTQIEEPSTVTDERGQARAWVRLPLAELPALATAEAGRQVVTFSATSRANTLSNFPRFNQTGLAGDPALGNESVKVATHGALLASSAAIVRYLQNNGELPSPNGPADPALLNQYLKDLCVFDAAGERVCDGFVTVPGSRGSRNLNPWRLPNFVSGSLDLQALAESDSGALQSAIRDSLGQGGPVLLALTLRAGEAIAGTHFVAAIGVAGNGAVLVHDPNPAFRRNTLDEYLNGFAAAGRSYQAAVSAALRFAPRPSSALGFLVVTGAAQANLSSPAGSCGFAVSWPEAPATTDSQLPANTGPVRFRYCDGVQSSYQLDLAGAGDQPFLLTDLGTVAGRFLQSPSLPAAFRLNRPASNWTVSLMQTSFAAGSVLNAATFTPELAPGTLAAVFGSGLGLAGRETQVEVDGIVAAVLLATPFQLNFQIPPALSPGTHTLRVRSPFGVAESPIELVGVAPALFSLPGGRGAAVNQDGTVNSPANAARRGQVLVIYGTGFGPLAPRGNLEVTATPVSGYLDDRELVTQFAGATPGIPGLYQINLSIPSDLPPGLTLRLTVQQQGKQSSPVIVAVQ